MMITVKILRGRECAVQTSVNSSISSVKQLVARELDIPTDQQVLVLRGKTLSDGQCLRDYNIVDGTKLYLVVRKTASDDTQGAFWTELDKTLLKHFTKEDAATVMSQFKKELSSTIEDSSLEDIDKFAQTCLHCGNSQPTSSTQQ